MLYTRTIAEIMQYNSTNIVLNTHNLIKLTLMRLNPTHHLTI